MQEINLLQNKLNDHTHNWESSTRTVNVVLVIVLIAELVLGGMFYFLTNSAVEAKTILDEENAKIQASLDEMDDQLADAKGFQAQTKNLETLLSNHVIWTSLVDTVESSALKNSRYLSMTSDTSGVITVQGVTPNYVELGKVLLALNTNDDFESVQLVSTGAATGEIPGISFSLDVKVKPNIFLTKE